MASRSTKKGERQSSFEFPQWGGARLGAGRKRTAVKACVEHRPRPPHALRNPVHVTLRFEGGLESLRKRHTYHVVRDATVAAADRFGLKIVHFAVMTNHVHLMCEAEDGRSLSRGIKGLCVRVARGLNKLWKRTGRVLADRYHARELATPREVRNVLTYLLNNARRHGIHFAGPDPFSSAMWFDGWSLPIAAVPARANSNVDEWCPDRIAVSPLPGAFTWLLRVGWRRHGLIPLASPSGRR